MYKNLFILVSLFWHTTTTGSITIEGTIASGCNAQNLKIEINGKQASRSGCQYQVVVNQKQIYQLRLSATNYYASIQTFSHSELELSQHNKEPGLILPAVSMAEKKAGRTMFAFGGDVMMGRRYFKPHLDERILIHNNSIDADTKSIVKHIKPYVEIADYSAINLETQIISEKPSQRAKKLVTFYSPPETLSALKWAGIDYVTLGNNHTYDYVDEGLIATLNYLEEYGMAFSGAGLNNKAALDPYKVTLNQEDYALLGFVGWAGGSIPNQVADKAKGGAAFGTTENINYSVKQASEAGSSVIVQYHGSLEYAEEPSAMTESRLKLAIDAGADLVLAHHPHVTQGFEVYKNKLIAYSMGNFIFDQYFPSTPLSYVLYVWMDGEEFYRAEIVPVYLKDYKPTPAMGMQREKVIKRTVRLSASRGVQFTRSGGHLVLKGVQEKDKKDDKLFNQKITIKKGEQLHSLSHFPVPDQLVSVSSSTLKSRYRLGQDQFNSGDFETYYSFDSPNREWLISSGRITENVSYEGSNSVALQINKQTSGMLGMKVFRRVFDAASPMTFSAKVLNQASPVKIKIWYQKRGTRDKLLKAMNNPKTLLREITLNTDESWQDIRVPFYLPRVGYRSYRILMEVGGMEEANQVLYLDSLSLIQWQAHYNEMNQELSDTKLRFQATHLEFESPVNNEGELLLNFK